MFTASQHHRRAGCLPGRGGEPGQGPFAHDEAAAARCSARIMSAVEVAPGS